MNMRDMIRQAAKEREELYSIVGTVKAVDQADMSCQIEPLSGDAEMYRVRLLADPLAGSYVLQVPQVGSKVIVTFLNKATGYVALCSEVDYIEVKAGETILKIDKNGHLIGQGTETLKQVLNDLIEQVKLITCNVTAVGSPTGPPINATAFTAINNRINALLQ